jgi:hypothetical protein
VIGDLFDTTTARRIRQEQTPDRQDADRPAPAAEAGDKKASDTKAWPDCKVCGKPAHFGFGVALRKGEIGRWSCALHRDQVRDMK